MKPIGIDTKGRVRFKRSKNNPLIDFSPRPILVTTNNTNQLSKVERAVKLGKVIGFDHKDNMVIVEIGKRSAKVEHP